MRTRLLLIVVVVAAGLVPHAATATPPCDPATQLCVTVDATQTNGPAKLRAQGFLNGLFDNPPNLDTAKVAALKPQHWRSSFLQPYWDGEKGTFGGAMSWIVRGEWWHAQAGSGKPPSADFAAYEAFVRALAQKHIDNNRPIDYWDIFNEPDIGLNQKTPDCSGYDPCHNLTYLEEIRHAAIALRSVDPAAKIVAPSTTLFRESSTPPQAGPLYTQLDLTSVLDWMVLHNVKIDAVSWHELNSVYYNQGRIVSPRSAIDHIAKARALIAARPSLGDVEVHINEYSTPWTEGLPGWEAGWIGALEDGNVDRANRSCWIFTSYPDMHPTNGCYGANAAGEHIAVLDGLFNTDGSTRSVYWVHKFYADMTGTRVAATADQPVVPIQGDDALETLPAFVQDPTAGSFYVSAFATRDDATGTVRALIGRHYSCSADGVNPCAPAGGNDEGNRPPMPVVAGEASVKWPYASGNVTVTVQRIPRVVVGAVSAPTTVSTTTLAATSGATIPVSLGQVGDGEAYTITIAPTQSMVAQSSKIDLRLPANRPPMH